MEEINLLSPRRIKISDKDSGYFYHNLIKYLNNDKNNNTNKEENSNLYYYHCHNNNNNVEDDDSGGRKIRKRSSSKCIDKINNHQYIEEINDDIIDDNHMSITAYKDYYHNQHNNYQPDLNILDDDNHYHDGDNNKNERSPLWKSWKRKHRQIKATSKLHYNNQDGFSSSSSSSSCPTIMSSNLRFHLKSNFLLIFAIMSFIIMMMMMIMVNGESTTTKKPGRLPQRFEMEPIDKTSIIGDTIILPCRVANKVGTLQWTRDGFGLGTERTLEGFQRYRMVGSDDEGDYSLEISPVTLEDDAVFQCQVGAVEGILGIRSRSAKFTVQVPPEPPVIVVTHAHSHAQVYKTSSSTSENSSNNNSDILSVSASQTESLADNENDHHLRTTSGMTIELTCEAHGGRPPAELTWMDSAGNPITNGVSYSTTKLSDGKRWNAALKWTVVASRALDGQRVTCRSENAALKSPRYAHIQLEVRYPPEVELRIASVGDSGLVKEGDDLTLECIAVGNPSRMTFKWSRDGVPLGTEGDVSASGDGTPRLVFRRVGKEFHGTAIACEVANSVGTSRATLEIRVAFKPRFVKLPEPVIGIAKSENIHLHCQIDSYPPAQIRWSRYLPKLTLEADETDRFTDHWQEIGDGPSIQVSSAGRYRCSAKNPAFEDELKGETLVFIKGAPLIRSPSIQYGIENEPVRLQCIVEAVPPPTRITWMKLKPYQQILGVDNNEGYEILEEEDPDDYSMFQSSPSYLTSGMAASMTASGSAGSSSSLSSIQMENENQLPFSTLALLRSIIYIRRAKDSDFGQYNCSVWNQYGFQSQIITLQKQSNILSPLVLTLSGIICFGLLFILIASLVVFICLRSQRLNADHSSLAPKKLDSNDHPNHNHNRATSCNGSIVDANTIGIGSAIGDDYKSINTTLNSLEKNIVMKNTIMKMNGSNQVLTTLTSGNSAIDLMSSPYNNANNNNQQQHGGSLLPIYNEYDSYNNYQYPLANTSNTSSDLIIANGNVINGGQLGTTPPPATTTTAMPYNYDSMATYTSRYLPTINDYISSQQQQQQQENNSTSSIETDKNKVAISSSNYYRPEHNGNNSNNMNNPHHLYSTVKKNHQETLDGGGVGVGGNSNNINGGGHHKNILSPSTNYATLLSPSNSNSSSSSNINKMNQKNSHHHHYNQHHPNQNHNENHMNGNHSYANTINYSIGQIRSSQKHNNQTIVDQFVNPYMRTSATIPNHSNSNLIMNHYSNVDPETANTTTAAAASSVLGNGSDRLLSAGVYNAHQHSRYKTNSLGGGSSSSGVISTGGSSPGHSPIGSMSGANTDGTHV